MRLDRKVLKTESGNLGLSESVDSKTEREKKSLAVKTARLNLAG